MAEPRSALDGAADADVIVIGAGIIGACIAYTLRRRGADVLLIEADEPGRGCSYGNSGALSTASLAPLAMPGIVSALPRMLLDPDAPLKLDPAYLPRALPWLLQFAASATRARAERAAHALQALHAGAVEAHVALAREIGAPELILQRGQLHLYPDETAFGKDRAAWELRARHGVRYQLLERNGILELEPRIGARYRCGVLIPDQATVVNPFRYVGRLVAAFVQDGGRLVRDRVRLRRDRAALHCDGVQRYSAAHIVVAAGIESRALLHNVDVRVPLISQRGYHVMFRDVANAVSRSVVLADRKVFLTPMEEGLRVGGTVEIAAPSRAPDERRWDRLADFAREALGDLPGRIDRWMGNRPCTPTSLPIIGGCESLPSLWLAIGHGHLGLTQSVATAQRIAEDLLPLRQSAR